MLQNIIQAGKQDTPSKALIMLHGEESSAADIHALPDYLPLKDFALYAPVFHQYEDAQYIDECLQALSQLIEDKGIHPSNTYWIGFSKGATCCLDWMLQHPQRYAGVAAFAGALKSTAAVEQKVDLSGTPVFLSAGELDAVVAPELIQQAANHLTAMNAAVVHRLYPGVGHTIVLKQLQDAAFYLFGKIK